MAFAFQPGHTDPLTNEKTTNTATSRPYVSKYLSQAEFAVMGIANTKSAAQIDWCYRFVGVRTLSTRDGTPNPSISCLGPLSEGPS